MNEQVVKKRDWIKNAVIVFLVVMLLLTFFSNTIMNYSLPEVSAQYVTSGSIQAKVRGDGVVEAGNPYMVEADSNRVVESVAVRNGDRVEKGQVLLVLEAGDSTELKEAEKTLEQLLDRYQQAAIAADIDPDTSNKILNGDFTDFGTYKVKVDALKREIKALEDDIALYEREIAKVEAEKKAAQGESSTDSKDAKEAYDASVTARKNAETALQAALAAAQVADVAAAKQALATLKSDVAAAQAAVDAIEGGSAYRQAEAIRAGYESAITAAKSELEEATQQGDTEAQAAAQAKWNQAEADLATHMTSSVYTELKAAQAALETVQKREALLQAVVDGDGALTAAKDKEAAAKKAYEAAGPDHSVAISQYDNVIKINQDYVDEQKTKLLDKQSELTDVLAQMSQENALSAELQAITDQREVIAKLRKNSGGGDIVAPVSGTVQDLMLTAGQSTTAGTSVATIIPEGMSYTMEVKVTKEQAQKLNAGDVADIQNSWYYSDVTAVLKQIKTDKADPAGSRILVFTVEGDVADGQSLSISIGQRSANYDCIVPNSAIREDNNGKFILIVSQKSSPLGNRYYAERVDVEVLGSDDTKTAVVGDMTSWEYVITTSTKPVEAGQLIRLAD